MAYTPCSATVTKNIVDSCTTPNVGGYTGRAVLIAVGDATFTQDSTNPRIVTGIALASGKKTIAVNNVFAEPFTGSGTQGNVDSGRVLHTKNLALRIPSRGADTSKNLVEAMEQSALGYVAVLEKKNKVVDGGFEVVGLQQGLKIDPSTVSRDEAANGGDILATLTCAEPWFESDLQITAQSASAPDYASTLAAFEELYTTNAN